MAYITTTNLRDYLHDSSNKDPALYEDAVAAANGGITSICGRSFNNSGGTVSARYYRPDSTGEVRTDDISTTTGLLVATDAAVNGTYSESWTIGTDFFLEPINQISSGISGWPYTKIVATWTTKSLPYGSAYRRPPVKVTADWGWAAVPPTVKQAALISGGKLYKLGDIPTGYSTGEWGAVRIRDIPEVMNLLDPFIKDKYAVA